MVFRLFWNLTRKNCFFTGKFFSGLSELLFTFPEEHLRRNISERKSWKLKDFWIIFEVLGKMAENIFQVWQNSNRCPREHFMGIFLQRRKIRYFLRFWATFFTSSEKYRQTCETRNLGIRGSFWRKTFSENYLIFHTSLDFDPKNAWSVIFFPGLSQMQSARPEAFFEEK